jgi:hypothetical protein
MVKWFFARLRHFWRLMHGVWLVIVLLYGLYGVATTILAAVLDDQTRAAYSKLLPHWTFAEWLVGALIIVVLGIAEKSYRITSDLETNLQVANQRIAELTKRPTLRVLGVNEWAHPNRHHFHYRLGLHNDGPGTATNVQVRLQSIEPRPSHYLFRGEFPYPMPDLTGHRGPRSISEHEEELYEIARSWKSEAGDTVAVGLDGFLETSQGRDEWRIALQEPCVLRLTVSYSDTVRHVAVQLTPADGKLNPRLI